METKYFSCKDRAELDKVIAFDGNYYQDDDIIIDVIGKINLNKPLEPVTDDDGNVTFPDDTREPVWSDCLFNVMFLTENKQSLFEGFKAEEPKTPVRMFL